MEMGDSLENRPSFAAFFIFFCTFALHLLFRFAKLLKKRGLMNTEHARLKQEIKQLLKEASSLSTPSTFAQAAKLKRIATAKEKELAKIQDCQNKEQMVSYDLLMKAVRILKVMAYLGLSWWFWGAPVAAIPQQFLQPFGKVLSWKAGESKTGHVMVGIVPWLIFTSRGRAIELMGASSSFRHRPNNEKQEIASK